MSIDYAQQLNLPYATFLSQLQTQLETTTNDEFAIKSINNNVGMHVREDNVLELFAGNTSIILDGNAGSILLNGTHLISSTNDVNLLTTQSNSVGINYYPFNPAWMNYGLLNSVAVHPELQALSYKPLSSQLLNVITGAQKGSSLSFITGEPQEGQSSVNFSSIFDSKPIFLPNVFNFVNQLNSILQELLF